MRAAGRVSGFNYSQMLSKLNELIPQLVQQGHRYCSAADLSQAFHPKRMEASPCPIKIAELERTLLLVWSFGFFVCYYYVC